ncbi:DUF1648 domain-containing protein [Vagococcus hydrophili]|uniref:DUF1648 domain-containing protein n=1 Tax=Vagococcus hydrophili TaxID=2714947 RepID=A0A6G8ATH5_9ENTE|nr:DUF5808 domain-containing protein [Vagococcus hydrophili]QIL48280.1 DUF1648 domain-containing protein [Vagococcus hydrophili]
MFDLIQLVILNLMIGVLLGITPFISHESLPFGVGLSLDDHTRDIVKHQKKSYLMLNIGISLLLTLIILVVGLTQNELKLEQLVYLSIGGLFIQIIVSLVVYVIKNKQLLQLKKELGRDNHSSQKVVVDLSFRDQKLVFPTSYLIILNLVFIAVTVLYTVFHYQDIPATFVTKWDTNMNPVQWSQKSWLTVLGIPMMQVFIASVMGIANHSFLKAKQRLDVNNPEVSAAQNKAFRKKSSLMNFIISVIAQILLMFVQFSTVFQIIEPETTMIASIIFTVLLVGMVIWVSAVYGQGGSRLKKVRLNNESIDLKEITQTFEDDTHWKWGLFYYNAEDPSVWVEKRMGLGVTTNFARWQTWVFLGSILIIPIVVVLVMS